MKLVNWKSYFLDEQVKEYNLSEYKDNNTYIKLFNTNDLNMWGNYQINYLNPYLGELPMMYYIWKNNLKSDYIKISQYRRDITYEDFNELDKNKIQLYCTWDEYNNIKLKDRILQKRDPSGYIRTKLWEFIKEHYKLSNDEINNIQNQTHYRCMAVFVWAMNWNVYCKLCEFIFGFLDKLFPNESWKNINTLLEFREKDKILYFEKYGDDGEWLYNDDRHMVHIIEDTLSVILGQFFDLFGNNKYWEDTYIITTANKFNSIVDVANFYKLNLKCNPFNIYIKCLDEKSYNEFYDFFINKYNWSFNMIKIIKADEQYNNKAIMLNINQYIDVNCPIDLYENKYTIKNI